MKDQGHKRARPPLDMEALERLGLHYVGRYATTRAKLRIYLQRKLEERGWSGDPPAVEQLIQRFSELGYVDDGAFAKARGATLGRRGYGERRILQALRQAGVDEDDAEPARLEARAGALSAALAFARRRRLGPFAELEPARDARQKAMAAMLRAGHGFEMVRRILDAAPGDIPALDEPESDAF